MRQSKGSALESCTNNHDGGANENSLATAELVTDKDTDYGADETAQIVTSNRDTYKNKLVFYGNFGNFGIFLTLNVRLMQLAGRGHVFVFLGGSIKLRESCNKRVEGQKTTHDTLVITEEKEIQTGNHTDCDIQPRSTKPEVGFSHDGGWRRSMLLFFLFLWSTQLTGNVEE
jgi:hypothetical protein